MTTPEPIIVLLFGPFDPSGSSNLPADAVTCAALGGHALSALTALRIQDTANIEDIQEIAPELIDDQARCLLEDMNVKAIKVGPVYTIDAVRVLAQIAADYNDVPLVLHLGPLTEHAENDDAEPEEVLGAMLELLLPATDLVLIEHSLLDHWDADGLLSGTRDDASPGEKLIEYGAKWVLTTGVPIRPGQSGYVLQGRENVTSNWLGQTPSVRYFDQYGPLACALTLQIAKGLPMLEAVESAIQQSSATAVRSFQPGMGYRIINRSAQP